MVLATNDSFVYDNNGKWYISNDEATVNILRDEYGSVTVSFVRDSQTFVMTYNGYEFEVREGITIGFTVQNYE